MPRAANQAADLPGNVRKLVQKLSHLNLKMALSETERGSGDASCTASWDNQTREVGSLAGRCRRLPNRASNRLPTPQTAIAGFSARFAGFLSVSCRKSPGIGGGIWRTISVGLAHDLGLDLCKLLALGRVAPAPAKTGNQGAPRLLTIRSRWNSSGR